MSQPGPEPKPVPVGDTWKVTVVYTANVQAASYIEAVQKLKDLIGSGDKSLVTSYGVAGHRTYGNTGLKVSG